MILASFVGIGFGVATVYAVALLRGKRDAYHRKAMLLGLTFGLVAIPLQMIAGDAIARSLATQQPIKLASMEAVYTTSSHVPLHLMGIPNVPQQSWFTQGLVIPDGLSLLVGFSPDTVVTGLNSVAANDRPSDALIIIIHGAFDLMVLFGSFMMLVAIVFWILFIIRKGRMPEYGWSLWGIIVSGPMALLALVFGWVVTEEGRQPWVIYNFLRTSDAVTTAPYLTITFTIFTILYILMSFILVVLLARLARTPMPKMEWAQVTQVNPSEKSTVSAKGR
jgi:cytochrome bd ubiquinol oxidase subunit I